MPPPPPINDLYATPTGTTSRVLLTWTPPMGVNVDYYILYVNEANQGHMDPGNSWVVAGLSNGIKYRFTMVVHSVDGGLSDVSNQSEATPTADATLASAPQNLVINPRSTELYLTWDIPLSDGGTSITSYKIFRSTSVDGSYSQIANPNIRSFTNTGLTNGTTYYYKICAVNSLGAGVFCIPVGGTPQAATVLVPDQPMNFIAHPGDTRIDLTWTPPISDGGSAITSYEVLWSPYEGSLSYNGLSAALTGLSNGVLYIISVKALNIAGPGDTALTTATPAGIPGAPTLLAGEAGNGEVVLWWNPPLNNGGTPISYYSIHQKTDINELSGFFVAATTPDVEINISDLINQQSYLFYVTANNTSMEGPASNTITLTPTASVPDAPILEYVTPGVSSVLLKWHASGDGGSSIIGYELWYGATSDASDSNIDVGAITSHTWTSIPAGTLYYFAVKAINAKGTSSKSNVISATAYSIPSAVSNLSATAGNAEVELQWNSPLDYYTPVTAFDIYYGTTNVPNTFSGTLTLNTPDYAGGVNVYRVSGLTNQTTYWFKVIAKNAAGSSGNSNIVSATPNAVVPAAPVLSTATAGLQSISITWLAPSYTGGSPITYYKIFYAIGANPSVYTLYETVSGLTLGYNITGLTPGTTYSICLKAVNVIGDSPLSNSKSATPYTVPGIPSGLAIDPRNQSAYCSWGAPSTGGSAILHYDLYYQDGTKIGESTSRTYTVTGLNNGQTYYIYVTAHNAQGEGSPCAAVAVTPRTTPGAPRNLVGVPGNTQVTLTWEAPLSNGGAVITNYRVTYLPSSGGAQQNQIINALTTIITGLTNGVEYMFFVGAYNAAGWGSTFTDVIRVTPNADPTVPNPPHITTCVPNYNNQTGVSSITIVWTPPANDGGSVITNYYIYMDTITDPAGPADKVGDVSGSTRTFTISNLTPTVTYYFRITAVNTIGESNYSENESAEAYALPSAPRNLQATAGDTQVTLNWEAPTSDGGALISYYVVYQNGVAKPNTYLGTTAIVTGLTNGVTYTFTVTAVNPAGPGPESNSVSATPTLTIGRPAAPSIVVNPGYLCAYMSWTPNSDGGSPITGYKIYYGTSSPASTYYATLPPTQMSMTVNPNPTLTAGTNYYFSVVATNAVGDSVPAESTAMPFTLPGAPTGLSATEGDTTVTLLWLAPSFNGYSPIDYYVVFKGGVDVAHIAPLTATVTGLTNATTYSFAIAAHNAAGIGPLSPLISATPHATPPTVPSAPAQLIAIPGNAEVTLSWSIPSSNGGSAIDYYLVYYGTINDPSTWVPYVYIATSNTQVITGLTNNVLYYFIVKAHNVAGYGPASPTATATPTPSVPSAPILISAIPKNTGVELTWLAPAYVGSGINRYMVWRGNSSTPNIFHAITAPDTLTYLSLYINLKKDDGTQADFQYFGIKATNSSGDSPMSNVLRADVFHLPEPPILNTLTAPSPTSFTLNWTAPTDTGNTSLLGFYAFYGTTSTPDTPFGGTIPPGVFTTTAIGLTAGIKYYFGVKTANIIGMSLMSNVMSLTSSSKPGAFILSGRVGDKKITLDWTEPLSNGSPISSYVVEQYENGVWSTLATVSPSSARSYIVLGLINGIQCRFRINAINAVGGTYSNVLDITPAGAPDPPFLVSATAGDASIALVWTPPSNNGGSAITGYSLYYGTTNIPDTLYTTIGSPTTFAFTIEGLTNGTTYYVCVRAVNAVGSSIPSNILFATPSLPIAVPEAPILSGTAGNRSVNLSWIPGSDGGSAVDYYSIYQMAGSTPQFIQSTINVYITLTNLVNGTPYTFKVAAHNIMGYSEYSNAVTLTPVAGSGAPRGLILSLLEADLTDDGMDDLGVVLQWSPPVDADTFLNVLNYSIFRSLTGASNSWVEIGNTVTNLLSYVDLNVLPNTQYWYYVKALNTSSVYSDPSNVASITTYKFTPPPTDIQLTKTISDPKTFDIWINVTWVAPFGATFYNIYKQVLGESYSLEAENYTLDQPYVNKEFDGRVSKEVRFGVSTKSNWGESNIAWSSYIDALSIAEAPIWYSLELDSENIAINLEWIAPAETNGFPITAYNIYRTVSTVSDPTIEPEPPIYVTTSNVTTYVDTGNGTPLVAESFYYYSICAVTAYAEGLSSLTESLGAGLYPSKPQDVIIQAMTTVPVGDEGASTSTARLSWSAPANHGSTPIEEYQIYYSKNGSLYSRYNLEANIIENTYYILGDAAGEPTLDNNNFYHFKIAAKNKAEQIGDFSIPVGIGTPKTITPPDITNLAYDGTFTLGLSDWELIKSNSNITCTAEGGSDNIAVGVDPGFAGTVGVQQKLILNNGIKHKIYVTTTSYVIGGRGSAILYVYDGNSLELTNVPTTYVSVDLPVLDEAPILGDTLTRTSLIIDCAVELNVRLSISNFDTTSRIGTLDNVVVIDLTEQFGAESADLLTTDDMDSLFLAYESTISDPDIITGGNMYYFPEILPINNSLWYNYVRLGGFNDTLNVKNIYTIWYDIWNIEQNNNATVAPKLYDSTSLITSKIYNGYVISLSCQNTEAYSKIYTDVNAVSGNHYYLTTNAIAYYRANSNTDIQIAVYDNITEEYISIPNDRTLRRHSTAFVAGSDTLHVSLTLTSAAGGAEGVFDGIMLLDLTTIFAADHEPTIGLMDALIGTLTGIDNTTTYGYWVETPQWEAQILADPVLNYDTTQKVVLTWGAATSRDDVTGYVVFRGVAEDALYEVTDGFTIETTWSDTDIALNQTYYYTIVPISNSTYGVNSNVVNITTGGTLDVAPVITSITILYTVRGVTLAWTPPTSDIPITGYNIYRRYNWETANFSTPFAVVGNVLTYIDNNKEVGLNPGGVYEYYISAITTVGEGRRSQPKDITTPFIVPVTNLVAEINVVNGASQGDLTWEYITTTGLTMKYDIFRTTNNTPQITAYGTTSSKSYIDVNIGSNKIIDYGVEAWDSVWGRSARTTVRATAATVPSAPRNFTAVNDAIGTITLTWVVPLLDGNSPILMYRIYKDASTTPIEVGPTIRTYADTGLTGGSTHTYYMCATNAIGNGANTPTKTVTVARAPLAPANFQITNIAGVPVLSWAAPAESSGATVMRYNIYIGVEDATPELMATTNSTIRETSHIYAEAGTAYEYNVSAVGLFDLEGVKSETIAHTAPESVKFLTIENMVENGGFDSLWKGYGGWTAEYKGDVSVIPALDDMPYEGSLQIINGYVYQDITVTPGETIMITLLANVGENTPDTYVRLRDTEDNILESIPIDIIGTNRYYLVYHTTDEAGTTYRLSLEVEGV